MTYRNDLIRAAVVNMDLNKTTFSQKSGIALNTVHKLWDGDVKIELPSLISASEFLKIPMQKLFEPKESEQSQNGAAVETAQAVG